jgi:DNA-binding LacI/PurR family transcriptional regulator
MIKRHQQIAKLMKSRIVSGDYTIRPFPSARTLARELGIGYVTARNAIEILIKDDYAKRGESGRIDIKMHKTTHRRPHIAIIYPIFSFSTWIHCIGQVVHERGGMLREAAYLHGHDPIISETLRSDEFDGIFFFPPENISPFLRDQILAAKGKLITIADDYTKQGIPCVHGIIPAATREMIGYLKKLGHQRINAIMTETTDRTFIERVEQWKDALEYHHLTGNLFSSPVTLGQSSGIKGYDMMLDLLKSHRWEGTALFCPGLLCAMGASKAIIEQGLTVGKDISICSYGQNEMALLANPTITIAKNPLFHPLIEKAMDWLECGGKNWDDSLMICAQTVELQIGESTGMVKSIKN